MVLRESLCALNRSSAPLNAKDSISGMYFLSNGLASVAPCNSMSFPSLFRTTLKSTSALKSYS